MGCENDKHPGRTAAAAFGPDLVVLSVCLPLALFCSAAAAGEAGPPAGAAKPASVPAARPGLIWSDEFSGTKLDPAKWAYRALGRRKGGYNVKEAVALDGRGHLMITTRKAGDRYETGMIGTQGLFERAFGYFECLVKFPAQQGHWAAFWLQSPRLGTTVGDTHASGTEIDIFEFLPNRPRRIQHTLHWDGYGTHHKSAAKVHKQGGLNKGWHTVGLEWTPKEYVFYVDGKETWRTSKAVSHTPQYIILSLEVGPWAGKIARATLPDSVWFDYVRVYKTRPAADKGGR